ncbi:MAG TPA: hypothetical protein VF802_03550 [Candidatus Limnocylindrales bacterium]
MTLSRRTLLRKAAGTGASLVFADVLGLTGERGLLPLTGRTDAATAERFFLYGLRGSASVPSLAGGLTARALSLNPIAQQLAAEPVRSPDGTKIAVATILADPFATVLSVSFIGTESGTVVQDGSLDLSSLPSDSSILVTPVFTADSRMLCIVLSITVPSAGTAGMRWDPRSNASEQVNGHVWTSHHALAYFDGTAFAGPFDLADAPSLARLNAFADERDLYLWTVDEYAAIVRRQGRGAPIPVPRLSVFPLGSGTPRLVIPAPGPWPVNDEPIVGTSDGRIIRLVYSSELEVYLPGDGSMMTIPIAPLADGGARPAAATLELRPSGLLFASKPARGLAVVLDPSLGFQASSLVRFPIPVFSGAAPSAKAALSPADDVLFTVGDGSTTGIAAYEVHSGSLSASFENGQQFLGIKVLGTGEILAVAASSPRLTLLTPSLDEVGRGDTDLLVAAIL